jgi:hypothetical protein
MFKPLSFLKKIITRKDYAKWIEQRGMGSDMAINVKMKTMEIWWE